MFADLSICMETNVTDTKLLTSRLIASLKSDYTWEDLTSPTHRHREGIVLSNREIAIRIAKGKVTIALHQFDGTKGRHYSSSFAVTNRIDAFRIKRLVAKHVKRCRLEQKQRKQQIICSRLLRTRTLSDRLTKLIRND